MTSIKGIKHLEVEENEDGSHRIVVVYTEEFIGILKRVLKKDRVTDDDVLTFLHESLSQVEI